MDEAAVTVYTALYGGYDDLFEPVAQDLDGVNWVCFTDNVEVRSDTWRVVIDPPRYEHPRMAAKWHKLLPHRALPACRWTIWIDANVSIDSAAFAREAIAHARSGGLAAFPHPQRDCIYDEAAACSQLEKWRDLPVLEQVASYRALGHPEHGGLWEGRMLARDSADPLVKEFGEAWLAECERWTYRDQLSLPVVALRVGLAPRTIPFHIHRHGPIDGVACWLHRRTWGDQMLKRFSGKPPEGTYRRLVSHTRPRRSVRILGRQLGNPWFDVSPHKTGW